MTGRVILSTSDNNVQAMDRDEIFDLLMNARQADWVDLELKDGRSLSGAIIFNEFKGTGRLINIDDEISVDFRAGDVRSVKF
ncbi:MAG: hypothetical protein H6832_13360 [Planctomycetes bacterium]|nr:hypothetical protein [Planctomycetota bacterium]MCB9919384.1 hypothetical protein [Planctomycetota bacterium]